MAILCTPQDRRVPAGGSSQGMRQAVDRLRAAIDWYNYRCLCERRGNRAEEPRGLYVFRGVVYRK